jgi:hypothetical protein
LLPHNHGYLTVDPLKRDTSLGMGPGGQHNHGYLTVDPLKLLAEILTDQTNTSGETDKDRFAYGRYQRGNSFVMANFFGEKNNGNLDEATVYLSKLQLSQTCNCKTVLPGTLAKERLLG